MSSEKTVLNSEVHAGNMAEIALQQSAGDFIARSFDSLYSTLLSYYREGKHGHEMLAVLGELSALEKFQTDLKIKISRRSRAMNKLEDITHEQPKNDY